MAEQRQMARAHGPREEEMVKYVGEVSLTLAGIWHRPCSSFAAAACWRAKPLEEWAGSCLRAAR